ncbi:MAG: thioredoxin [Polyangiaceae bacterium]|nr:thioredoxin [Polyangiaceae bacterium]
MASKNVIQLNELNFDAEVLSSKEPVLVDFTATWCAPCKMLSPIVDQYADETVGKVKVAKLDIDEARAISAKFGVQAVPTLMVFQGGQRTRQHTGVMRKDQLARFVSGED